MFYKIDTQHCSLIKEQFRVRGVTIRSWAEENGFDAPLVYALLGGRLQGVRGRAHEAAVALGLKPQPTGALLDDADKRGFRQ